MRFVKAVGFRAILVITGVVLVAASVLAASHAVREPDRGLVCDQPSLDLGKIRQQEQQTVAFAVRNTSPSVMRFEEVMTSCACSVARFEKRELGPREPTRILAEFRAGSHRGPIRAQLVVLHSREGQKGLQRLVLEFVAEVTPHYSVLPAGELVFSADRPVTQRVFLTSLHEPPVRVLGTTEK